MPNPKVKDMPRKQQMAVKASMAEQSAAKLKKSPALAKLSASCKAAARRKFKVYPSAYANMWASRTQKKRKVLKDFDITPFKKMKPPSDSSFDTAQELKELKKIPLNKSFVKKFDNIESAFAKTAKDNNIEDYDKKVAAKLIKDSAPVILELKKHFNRPRPKELDKNLPNYEMSSMKTKSYPSGHSVQGTLIAKVLGDKYPKSKSAFVKTGENISYSRRVARAHYKSDSKMGDKLGNSMYKHIKNKI